MKIKKELLVSHGDTIEKLIRMGIRNVAVIYSRDYRSEIGNLSIEFLQGRESYSEISSWEIYYEFKLLDYTLHLAKHIEICLDITNRSQKIVWGKDEKTGKFYEERIVDWLIKDHATDFKIITHPIEEAEIAEELNEPKTIKNITQPNVTLEYYEKSKIFKSPFFGDEIRIHIKNENLEYIRNNKKIIKAYPLNKEIHFYGIKPEIWKYAVTREGEELISITR